MLRTPPQEGFTLIEFIVVMVVASAVAVGLTYAVRPALIGYADVRLRSDVANQADVALQRMVQDVRRAVPNSLRTPDSQCIELVPTWTGGRYRMRPDTQNDNAVNCAPSATCSAPVDTSTSTTVFDSLTDLLQTVSPGDWVVIDNQNVNDVYTGSNRSAVVSVSNLSGAQAWQGKHRITINSLQVPAGYLGGRFQVVRDAEQAVFYVCSGVGTDASGRNGAGTLYRLKRYGFNAAYPTACPTPGASADVIATRVAGCSFEYAANQGATQQSGYLRLSIDLMRNGEKTHLSVGSHVLNVP